MIVEPSKELSQLRWQARRGMLELDLMLEDFIVKHYAGLFPVQQQRFLALLQQSDQVLSDWLFGRAPLPKGADGDMILYMRHCYQASYQPSAVEA